MKIKLKNFFGILLFAFLVVCLLVQITYAYRGEIGNTRAAVAGFYDESPNSIDVVFVGASYMFSSYMPMEAYNDYGIVSYNFSINGMFTDSYKYYIREAFKYQSPQLCVINCGSFVHPIKASGFKNDQTYVRYNTDALMISKNRFDLINQIFPENCDKLNYYSDLLFYHSIDMPNARYWGNKKHSVTKGWYNMPLYKENIYTDIDLQQVSVLDPIMLDSEVDALLTELLEELNRYDTKVLFIAMPDLNINGIADARVEEYKYIENRVNKYGYDFLNLGNFYDDIKLNPSFDYSSSDGKHYNPYGAKKITKFLSEYIVEHYDIPDRREEQKYDSWAIDYSQWKAQLNEDMIETANEMIDAFRQEVNYSDFVRLVNMIDSVSEYCTCDIMLDNRQIDLEDVINKGMTGKLQIHILHNISGAEYELRYRIYKPWHVYEGLGTEMKPYIIKDMKDYESLIDQVHNGISYKDKYFLIISYEAEQIKEVLVKELDEVEFQIQ